MNPEHTAAQRQYTVRYDQRGNNVGNVGISNPLFSYSKDGRNSKDPPDLYYVSFTLYQITSGNGADYFHIIVKDGLGDEIRLRVDYTR